MFDIFDYLLKTGFSKDEADEILEYLACGCTFDNAVQRVMEK